MLQENALFAETRNLEEKVCVIIPMFQVASHIQDVISGIPEWVWKIIVVNDASPDDCEEKVKELNNGRVTILSHAHNQGVGAATLTGFNHAIDMGATIMVKMDGDNQMSPDHLEELVYPIMEGRTDYVKGNRFFHSTEILAMPFIRRLGNIGLSFLAKVASGYWNIFDPANGYLAIDAETFTYLDQNRISRRFYFETSMLIELSVVRAVVADLPIPAKYAGEESSLSIRRTILGFPPRLLLGFLRRIWLQYFVIDFSVGSLFFIVGIILCVFGSVWGLIGWRKSILTKITASTGTVMIAVLPLILGFQLILQAIVYDVQNVPKKVRSRISNIRDARLRGE